MKRRDRNEAEGEVASIHDGHASIVGSTDEPDDACTASLIIHPGRAVARRTSTDNWVAISREFCFPVADLSRLMVVDL